jgi:hypothetical protein
MNHDTRTMNPKPPTNRNRRRSHALIRWADLWILTATIATAAILWLAAYSITNAIIQ